MNRVIKFRAWDKKEKKMVYNVIPMHGGLSSGIIKVSYEGFITGRFQADLSEPMQFTGVYDTFQKEVYEGDIVDIISSSKSGEYEVMIVNGSLRLKIDDRLLYGDHIFNDGSTKIEVIGNIYNGGAK